MWSRTPNHKDRESFNQVQRPTGAGDADGAEAPVRLTALPSCENWPFNAAEAKRRQQELGETKQTVDLGEGVRLELTCVPAGSFVLGSDDPRFSDEGPRHPVKIDKPFWIGRFEVTNRQFALFNPNHDSRVESRHGMQFGVRGFYVNGPDQPAVRVSWEEANAFCDWLSKKTGKRFALPTEAQWEYACRAGTETPFSYGDENTDFSPFANLADRKLVEFHCHPYFKERLPLKASKYDNWIPKDERFDDGGFVSDATGRYKPNAWGLYDMHGNVAEWTRSAYRSYPYQADDGRNDTTSTEPRVVRGGSWRDRPLRSRSAFRVPYRPYQGVYNVGFRVVCEEE